MKEIKRKQFASASEALAFIEKLKKKHKLTGNLKVESKWFVVWKSKSKDSKEHKKTGSNK
jgi:hypothetical protein